MNSNLSSALFGAIIILLCILPFFILSRNKRKKTKKQRAVLEGIAAQKGGHIDHFEVTGHISVGMDRKNKFFYFHDDSEDAPADQIIDLKNIRKCHVIRKNKVLRGEDGDQRIIDRLELGFIPVAKKDPEIKIVFYDSDVSMRLYDELDFTNRWAKLINELITPQ